MPSPTEEKTTRKEQRERTRDRILSAAVDHFARAGFDATSLAGIAGDAGVKKALVQYHFKTKDELWKQAAQRVWTLRNEALWAYIEEQNLGDDYATQLRDGFTALITYTQAHPQWLRIMFHESAANTSRLTWLIENFMRDDYLAGEAFVRDAQKRGLMRSGSSLHLLHLISGALTYNLLVAPQTLQATATDLGSEESIAMQVDLLMDMLSPKAG